MAHTIKQWRQHHQLTELEMAEKLNIHINRYRSWEKHPESISPTNARKIALIFNTSIHNIIFKGAE